MRRKKRHIDYLIDLERKIKKGYPVRFKTRNEFALTLDSMPYYTWRLVDEGDLRSLKALLNSSIKGRKRLPYGYFIHELMNNCGGNEYDTPSNRKIIQDLINDAFDF